MDNQNRDGQKVGQSNLNDEMGDKGTQGQSAPKKLGSEQSQSDSQSKPAPREEKKQSQDQSGSQKNP